MTTTPNLVKAPDAASAIKAALAAAQAADTYAIVRVQEKRDFSFLVINGQTEHIGVSRSKGIGVQAFTPAGHTGFAAGDDYAEAVELAKAAANLAKLAESRDLDANTEVFAVPPLVVAQVGEQPATLNPAAIEARLKALNAELRALDDRLSVRTTFLFVNETWHIGRSDGTDCAFPMVRARAGHEITARAAGKAASANAGVVGVDPTMLDDPATCARLLARAKRAADLAIGLLEAPRLAGGSYKLVLDYALAKGLAHEAFGHAAETDAMDTSILGKDGQFRRGERVAPDFVSILDGPLPGDYAYQPISANGEHRETVHIVRNGVLDEALADTFSARRAGARPSGAARAENYACLPMPRMTNTRIEVTHPIPLDKAFEDVSPADVREVLLANGLMQPGERVLYLSGYKGGQVDITRGDFVFNCTAIHDLSDLTLYQPAIFSGKVLSVLSAILAGIGDPLTNAPGMCGKRGQSVPSSGGCHAFLVVDSHEDVKVGGKA